MEYKEIPEGTYQLIAFANPKNPRDGIVSKLFNSEEKAMSALNLIQGDYLVLRLYSSEEGFWKIVKLNYSKKNIFKLFKK